MVNYDIENKVNYHFSIVNKILENHQRFDFFSSFVFNDSDFSTIVMQIQNPEKKLYATLEHFFSILRNKNSK